MTKHPLLPAFMLLLAALPLAHAAEPAAAAQDDLFRQVSQLDRETFDAFNRCSDSAQLQKHASYFDAGE